MTAPISLRILSDKAIREIHEASLDILDRTGVLVEDEPVRAMLARTGCYVEGERVRIPSTVVEEALRLAPKRVTVWDRDGRSIAMHLEARHNYFGGGSDCPFVIDHETGERRGARLEDVARLARLNDGLTHINFIMSMALPQDVPAEISDVLAFLAMTENSTKPICFTVFTPERLETIYQVMKAIRSEADLRRRPFAIHYAEPVSPLRHPS
jgi:trimethylamine--corrinoid protein Co-methyltransferase